MSLGLGCRALMPGVSVGHTVSHLRFTTPVDVTAPYKAAAQRQAVHVSVVGMSHFPSAICGPKGRLFKTRSSLDTGCTINSVSEQFFLDHAHEFCGPDSTAQLCQLDSPVSISMFAGAHSTVATHCLTGVQMYIGKGVYTADFLIVKGANFNLVLGNNFLYDYAGRVWMRDFADRQSGRYLVLPLPQRLCQPGETAPQPPSGKAAHWYPHQRVPLSYEVFTDTWSVTPVSTYA